MRYLITTLAVLCVCSANPASAQSLQADLHFSLADWSEFEGDDKGIGGRLTWKPLPLIGVDADLTWYPSEYPEQISFSESRFEGLFAVTVGPQLGELRPFVKAGAGFLNVGGVDAIVCVAIFPPPLSCVLAGGQTLPAYEIGGGLQLDFGRGFIRADAADRILKYPGPTLSSDFTTNEDGFLGHALRLSIGLGIKF
jgi:hypothetical protein